MKNKNLFISNFKFNQENNKTDNLVIEDFYNISLTNGYIQTETSSQNILLEFFSDTISQKISVRNTNILNTTKQFISYDYFDTLTNSYNSDLYVITNDNKLYKLNKNTNYFEEKYSFNSFPKIINSNDELYFFDTTNCVLISENSAIEILALPNIDSFETTNDSLFFTTTDYPQKIFKTELCKIKELSQNIEQYSNYKIDTNDGEILKIVNLKEKIYIISKYSIYKFDEDDNMLIKQNSLETEIFKNAINVLDDLALMFTSSGLFAFDGNDTDKLISNYLNFNKNAKSIIFNQNLYVICSNLTNSIYKFNLKDNYFLPIYINKVNDINLLKTKNHYNLYANKINTDTYENITIYSDSKSRDKQKITFKTTTFGTANQKIIRSINFKLTGAINLKISSDITSYKVNLTNSQTINNISLQGSYFDITITASSDFILENLIINYDELGD